MKTKRADTQIVGLVCGSVFALLAGQGLFAQGNLVPPGSPGPIFKTLNQIEPRTPVESLPAGGGGKYQITLPGSYYLSSNLVTGAGQHGVVITTNDITLDLNGFTMYGVTNRTAILGGSPASSGMAVRNGQLKNWNYGINFQIVSNVVIEDLNISCVPGGAFRYGINSGVCSRVRRCTVDGAAGTGCVGITLADEGTIEACQVSASQRGIVVGSGCRIEGCVARDCPTGEGIFGLSGCIFRNNYAERCEEGIRVLAQSVVADNLAVFGAGSGFYAAGSYNRFERNAAHFNRTGIQTASGTTNFVAQNVAHGNTNQNYSFLGNVVAGPLVTTVGVVTNHAWANFSF